MSKISYIKTGESIQKKQVNFKSVALSSVFGLLLSFLLLFVFALLLTYANFKMDIAPIIAKSVFYFCSFVCGFLAAANTKSNGWLSGLLAGMAYYVLTFVVCLLFKNKPDVSSVLLNLIIVIFLSVTGGIAGVNIKLKKRKR